MNYEELIESVSLIVENEKIYKNGMTIIYELTDLNHKQMNEELFYKSNPPSAQFVKTEEFEVELGGIIIKFVKQKKEISEE